MKNKFFIYKDSIIFIDKIKFIDLDDVDITIQFEEYLLLRHEFESKEEAREGFSLIAEKIARLTEL